jgi:hypothetical protein
MIFNVRNCFKIIKEYFKLLITLQITLTNSMSSSVHFHIKKYVSVIL